MNGLLLVHAGVDWVTATTSADGLPTSEMMTHLRGVIIGRLYGGQAGMLDRPWVWQGYTGRAFGPLRVGFRRDGAVFQVSGDAAGLIVSVMDWMGWRGTRVDAQMTVRVGDSASEWIRRAESLVLMARRTGAEGRPVSLRYIDGHGDGDTLYLGSRRSQVFGRIYDKGVESAGDERYAGCIRLEVELKGAAAARALGQLADATDQSVWARRVVGAQMSAWGVGALLPEEADPRWRIHSVPRATDLERQLSWLERSVLPVVNRLRRAGYSADVDAVLGYPTARILDTRPDVWYDTDGDEIGDDNAV